MVLHLAADPIQLGWAKTVVGRDRHWLEPKLRFQVVPCHVDMGRFAIFSAVEMKSIWANAEHRGHRCHKIIQRGTVSTFVALKKGPQYGPIQWSTGVCH